MAFIPKELSFLGIFSRLSDGKTELGLEAF